MDKVKVAENLVAAGTALAGLILVFLGSVFTAYESYAADAKKAVKSKFKFRATIAFIGFLCAILASVLGFSESWGAGNTIVQIGVIAMGIAGVATVAIAVLAVSDLF